MPKRILLTLSLLACLALPGCMTYNRTAEGTFVHTLGKNEIKLCGPEHSTPNMYNVETFYDENGVVEKTVVSPACTTVKTKAFSGWSMLQMGASAALAYFGMGL